LGSANEVPNRNDDMARLNAPGAGLNEQRVKDEVVVPIDQRNVGVEAAEMLLQRTGAICARETGAENDNVGAFSWLRIHERSLSLADISSANDTGKR
jgi:hypothetical protein